LIPGRDAGRLPYDQVGLDPRDSAPARAQLDRLWKFASLNQLADLRPAESREFGQLAQAVKAVQFALHGFAPLKAGGARHCAAS
jgi:hypothetical protein